MHAAKMAGGYDVAKTPKIKENFRRIAGGATCRWNEFIPFWNERYRTTRTVNPAKPTGRPPTLPAKLVTTIAAVWTQKTTGTGRNTRHYLNKEPLPCRRILLVILSLPLSIAGPVPWLVSVGAAIHLHCHPADAAAG